MFNREVTKWVVYCDVNFSTMSRALYLKLIKLTLFLRWGLSDPWVHKVSGEFTWTLLFSLFYTFYPCVWCVVCGVFYFLFLFLIFLGGMDFIHELIKSLVVFILYFSYKLDLRATCFIWWRLLKYLLLGSLTSTQVWLEKWE